MTNPLPMRQRLIDEAAFFARWVLGALFIYMGMMKALHPVDFLKLVRQYDIVQNPYILDFIAAALPWFEVFLGAMLLAGVAVRGVAVTVVALLIPFTALVWHRALLLQTMRAIPFCAVKFDCGCGGGEEFICGKLGENFVLILLSCGLLWARSRKFCARYSLWPTQSPDGQTAHPGGTS